MRRAWTVLTFTVTLSCILQAAAGEKDIETLIQENRYTEAAGTMAGISEDKAAPVKRLLDATLLLRRAVAEAIAAGTKMAFADRIMGQPARGTIVSADESGVEVDFGVTRLRKEWAEVTPMRLVALARAAKPNDDMVLLASYRVARACSLEETWQELLDIIEERTPALLPEAKKLVSTTFEDTAAASAADKSAEKAEETPAVQVVKPEEDSERVLKLPDCGWLSRVMVNYRPSYLDMANVVYNRAEWKEWDPDGGRPLQLAKSWLNGKRYFAFRVMANRHDTLPERLRTVIPSVKKDTGSVIPMYWDQTFIDEHKKLVTVLAREIGQHPYLCYVDIGAVGDTGGEWVLYGDWNKMGMTPDKADNLVWSFTKMYREAFPPYVRLYLATAAFQYAQNRQELVDYCKKNNIGRRLDGLCGETTKPNFWARSYKSFWKDTPFQWEGAYTTLEWERDGAYSTPAVLEAGLEYGPSIITYADNHVDGERFEKSKADILKKYGARLGYRFAIKEAAYPGVIRPGAKCNLVMIVTNKGCTRCYADREMELSFLDTNGAVVAAMRTQPTPGTSQWMPDEEKQVVLPFAAPGLGGGTYILAIALMDDHPLRPDNRIEMAMKTKTKDNRYILGAITVR